MLNMFMSVQICVSFFLLYECDAMGDERESYLWLAFSSFNLVLLVDFTRLHRMIEQIEFNV